MFQHVPAQRSVIAYLRRNPAINAEERHRLENEALDRRHDRERHAIDRRAAALDKIEARERRGLIRNLVRQSRVANQLREAKTEQREREVQQTADEITAVKPDQAPRENAVVAGAGAAETGSAAKRPAEMGVAKCRPVCRNPSSRSPNTRNNCYLSANISICFSADSTVPTNLG